MKKDTIIKKENWECDAHIDFEYKNFYIWY